MFKFAPLRLLSADSARAQVEPLQRTPRWALGPEVAGPGRLSPARSPGYWGSRRPLVFWGRLSCTCGLSPPSLATWPCAQLRLQGAGRCSGCLQPPARGQGSSPQLSSSRLWPPPPTRSAEGAPGSGSGAAQTLPMVGTDVSVSGRPGARRG